MRLEVSCEFIIRTNVIKLSLAHDPLYFQHYSPDLYSSPGNLKIFFFQLRILVKKSQREGKEMGLYFCLALACVSMYANLCSGIQFYNCTPPVYVPENAIEENAIEKTLTLPSRIACASFVIRYQAIGFYFHGEFLNFIYYNSVEYFNHLL